MTTASGRNRTACSVERWIRTIVAQRALLNSLRLAAIALKASESVPISSLESTRTTRSRFPDLISFADSISRRNGTKNPFLRKEHEPHSHCCADHEEDDHMSSRGSSCVPGPLVCLDHVLLIHVQDGVCSTLHPLEQGQKLREIRLPLGRKWGRGIFHGVQRGLILRKECLEDAAPFLLRREW